MKACKFSRFIYTCLGIGIVLCLSTLSGHMVANCISNSTLAVVSFSNHLLAMISSFPRKHFPGDDDFVLVFYAQNLVIYFCFSLTCFQVYHCDLLPSINPCWGDSHNFLQDWLGIGMFSRAQFVQYIYITHEKRMRYVL